MSYGNKGIISEWKSLRRDKWGAEILCPLCGVMFDLDWKIATRLEMIELARDLITKSYYIGYAWTKSLPIVLKAVIEGKGLFEHNIGEFFLLYGKFEQKYRLPNGKKTRAKMVELVNGDSRYLKTYMERGKERPRSFAICCSEHSFPCRKQSEYSRPGR